MCCLLSARVSEMPSRVGTNVSIDNVLSLTLPSLQLLDKAAVPLSATVLKHHFDLSR